MCVMRVQTMIIGALVVLLATPEVTGSSLIQVCQVLNNWFSSKDRASDAEDAFIEVLPDSSHNPTWKGLEVVQFESEKLRMSQRIHS